MPPQRLQFEGPSLEELLGQVQREHGQAVRIVQAEKVRSGGVAGFFARERYQLDLEIDDPVAAEPDPLRAAAAAPMSVLELAERVNDQQRDAVDMTARPAWPSVSTENRSFAEVLSQLQQEAAAADPARARDAAGGRLEAVVEPAALATTGLDERRLLQWLQSIPSVPRPVYAPGQVLVVAGKPERALRTASALAEELGVDPPSVFLATPAERTPGVAARRRLSDPAGMAVRRAKWARQPHSTIVALDAPLVLRPEGWARSALAALAPSFVYGAVAATTKTEDVQEWARRLGRIDALAVDGLDATLDPASILAAEIPVALLEGRPATTHLWAALLADRMR
jgi:hypothetical protein